jgi:competence protein ComFC
MDPAPPDLSAALRPSSIANGVTGGWFRDLRASLLSIVFPSGCLLCQQLLAEPTRLPICNLCLDSLEPLTEKICDICGRPLGPAAHESPQQPALCIGCSNEEDRPFAFDRARSWSVYQGKLVHAILVLKFEDIQPLGVFFARLLADLATREGFQADVVVPVPLHRQRERERGYNQAALIAKPLAKLLGLPYKSVLLTRIRPRPNKQILSLEERWKSVRGAFATRPGSHIDNQRVLLVDDVLTTGATLDSCAKALRAGGAKSVLGLTVARSVLKSPADSLP